MMVGAEADRDEAHGEKRQRPQQDGCFRRFPGAFGTGHTHELTVFLKTGRKGDYGTGRGKESRKVHLPTKQVAQCDHHASS